MFTRTKPRPDICKVQKYSHYMVTFLYFGLLHLVASLEKNYRLSDMTNWFSTLGSSFCLWGEAKTFDLSLKVREELDTNQKGMEYSCQKQMKILTMNAMPKETKGSFPFYDSLLGRKTSNNRENRKKLIQDFTQN